jgi:hypothetical protein
MRADRVKVQRKSGLLTNNVCRILSTLRIRPSIEKRIKGTGMRVLIQLRHSEDVAAASMTVEAVARTGVQKVAEPVAETVSRLSSALPGFDLDSSYAPIQLPGLRRQAEATMGGLLEMSLTQPLSVEMAHDESTYLVRGVIPDEGTAQQQALAQALQHPRVVGVFSDPAISTTLTCGGDPPVGTAADVGAALGADALNHDGLDGEGVLLAIVDTGVNVAYLQAHGRHVELDEADSWTPAGVPTTPGHHSVAHGTMCAFDAGIAAPKAGLIDDAVLLSQTPGTTVMEGLLSDAVKAYGTLLGLLTGPSAGMSLVVSNSWGMFDPKWDFPVGSPGNYSDNPNHPFNIIAASLEAAGADILFAAGNCGRDCPDGRCRFQGLPICGANSLSKVLSIAGVDVNGNRVGYSSQGPGRIDPHKPDIASYTHFEGSGVFAPDPDSGTSAACPVAAGILACIRTRYPSSQVSPDHLRTVLTKTAKPAGEAGWDADYGWGIIDPAAALAALASAAKMPGAA